MADESFIEKAEVWYWEGGTPMVAASGGLIGLGLLVALCCCWDIRKAVSTSIRCFSSMHKSVVFRPTHAMHAI